MDNHHHHDSNINGEQGDDEDNSMDLSHKVFALHQFQVSRKVSAALALCQSAITILQGASEQEAYHISALIGKGWVDELLDGHPKRIRSELGVHKHVFL